MLSPTRLTCVWGLYRPRRTHPARLVLESAAAVQRQHVHTWGIFGTVFTAKAQLFEAKDNELLLSLPVRPRDILASRMVSLLLWNLLFGVLVAVPALLAWTQAARLPALGFVSFILLLPALACF